MTKKNNNELGSYIKEKREKLGIGQRKLARLSNIDPAEVSRIEAGKRQKPNILFLKGIAESLDLSLVDLMQKAGYSEIDINWGRNIFSEKRSATDYQNQIKEYERFYFDVLEEIENRRKTDFAVKGAIADLIDKLELSKIENKELSNNEILDRLKEIIPLIRPNLEKYDKDKYPKIDRELLPKE